MEQARHQFGEDLARPHGTGRTDAAMVPPANHGGDAGSVPEPHFFQGLQSLRIVFAAGEDELALCRTQGRRFFEKLARMADDPVEMLANFGLERGTVCVAEKDGKRLELSGVVWKGVDLFVLDHLQAMLDAP